MVHRPVREIWKSSSMGVASRRQYGRSAISASSPASRRTSPAPTRCRSPSTRKPFPVSSTHCCFEQVSLILQHLRWVLCEGIVPILTSILFCCVLLRRTDPVANVHILEQRQHSSSSYSIQPLAEDARWIIFKVSNGTCLGFIVALLDLFMRAEGKHVLISMRI